MNIRDIEDTLRTLKTRHPGLNEVMLVTLLKAGGWEDKDVETARVLFNPPSSVPKPIKVVPSEAPTPLPSTPIVVPDVSSIAPPTEETAVPVTPAEEKKDPVPVKSFPVAEEAPLLIPIVDESHLVEAPHEGTHDELVFKEEEKEETTVSIPSSPALVAEPTSLLSKEEAVPPHNTEDIPHNLPLRPFETSEHIWPFSRYKDVFYGEDVTPSAPVPSAVLPPEPVLPVQPLVVPSRPAVQTPPQKIEPAITVPIPLPTVRSMSPPTREPVFRAPPDVERKVIIVEKTGDEKLVIMASVMLLAILLLLGYMYSNGRL